MLTLRPHEKERPEETLEIAFVGYITFPEELKEEIRKRDTAAYKAARKAEEKRRHSYGGQIHF